MHDVDQIMERLSGELAKAALRYPRFRVRPTAKDAAAAIAANPSLRGIVELVIDLHGDSTSREWRCRTEPVLALLAG